MTRLQFASDFPLFVVVTVAVAAAVFSWRCYRHETRSAVARPLSWLLPLLRCTAMVLVILVVSGPILRHRRHVGQLGRILVFVDNSRSMSLSDEALPASRKLLIAQQNGWLPTGAVDDTLWTAANRLEVSRSNLANALMVTDASESEDESALRKAQKEFRDEMMQLRRQLRALDAGALEKVEVEGKTWEPFLEEFESALVSASSGAGGSPRPRELLGAARSAEQQLRRRFDTACAELADSADPTISTALVSFDGHSRWSRAELTLLDPEFGLLAKLSEHHHLELFTVSEDKARSLWNSYSAESAPTSLDASPTGRTTNLAAAVRSELTEKIRGNDGQASGSKTAVLIISDGQHNRGPSPVELATQLAEQGVPVFTLGLGGSLEPEDVAILRVEYPETAHRSDQVRGVVTIKDRVRAGTSFALQIVDKQENVVWEEQLKSTDVDERRVPFEFSMKDPVTRTLQAMRSDNHASAVGVAFEARIAPIAGETEIENNRAPLRIKATVRDRNVLILAGRSRWELRYLRNLFERDEHWRTNTVVAGPGTDQPKVRRGKDPGMFPPSDADLQAYDLIVLGELAPGVLDTEDQGAIRRFVENHAGGLVFIDGRRGYLRKLDSEAILPLIPVQWKTEPLPRGVPASIELTPDGLEDPSLTLRASAEENEQLWKYLPPPRSPVPVKALPGAIVLAQARWSEKEDQSTPLFVTRQFGAGRVFYSAADETWRWRFKNADTYHQRFWNQVANALIEEPFAVQSDYLSLDTDSVTYLPGQQARLRVRLRDSEGTPVLKASADALLWKRGQQVAALELVADENDSGIFRTQTPPLEEGEYEISVRAAGFSNEALLERVSFSVFVPGEDELKVLRRNDGLLRDVARASNAEYVREEEHQRLSDLLRPLSSGRVIETETVLWQSY
ncbi:MAG: hypothetical protein AAF517_11740, partial [Planctomycetota bacterium]